MKPRLSILSVLLSLLLLTGAWSKSIVYFAFELNQEWIAANTCENRAKPAKGCNGKCQLSKQLQAEEKQQKQAPQLKGQLEIVALQHSSGMVITPLQEANIIPYFENEPFLLEGFGSRLIQPPQQAV